MGPQIGGYVQGDLTATGRMGDNGDMKLPMNPWLIAACVTAAVTFGIHGPASAGQWEVCKMEVKVLERITGQTQRIRAQVKQLWPQSDTAECPQVGAEISMFPETADYQHPLRTKYWPKVGQVVRWRYIYLDGICKASGPCRIRHYPIGW